jgi:hypothetical protein
VFAEGTRAANKLIIGLPWMPPLLHGLQSRFLLAFPVTGTFSVAYLEENVAAAEITLSDDEFETQSDIGSRTRYLGCGGTARGDMS